MWAGAKSKETRQQHQAVKPEAVSASLDIDKEARYLGTVLSYYKWSGYGFIVPSQPGLVPSGRLYVNWSNIMSEDRYPHLLKGMNVEFGLMKKKEKRHDGVLALRARMVTLPGGDNIALQDDIDAQKKTFVGAQHARYTGTLKFYNPLKGFGYITMDESSRRGLRADTVEEVPRELRVEEQEVNAGGKRPRRMENVAVEFGIVRTRNGDFMAYNMTMTGGKPLLTNTIENRQILGPRTYTGTLTSWNWRQGWGFVTPEASQRLPPQVLTKMSKMVEHAKNKGKSDVEKVLYCRRSDFGPGARPETGLQVTFQVYTDDKGAGAFEIH